MFKPKGSEMNLRIQDDHNRRMTDISFRHLAGAYENHISKSQHDWFKKISNDDVKFGKSDYMIARREYLMHESEEYTQALASVVFSHVWILSATNYFRLAYKQNNPAESFIVKNPSRPDAIAEALGLPKHVIESAKKLHEMRNTIMHLVETDPKTAPIAALDFKSAYCYAKVVWIIYVALLRKLGIKPDANAWLTQTSIYSLPRSISEQW